MNLANLIYATAASVAIAFPVAAESLQRGDYVRIWQRETPTGAWKLMADIVSRPGAPLI